MFKKWSLSVLLILSFSFLYAQWGSDQGYEIPFIQPKPSKARYFFSEPGIKEINLKIKNPKRSRLSAGEAAGDVTRGMLSGLFGLEVSGTQEMTWLLKAELDERKSGENWQVELHCAGELEKTSSRTRNDDGSRSISSDKIARFFWENNALGFLHHAKDTLGNFTVYLPGKFSEEMRNRAAPLMEESAPTSNQSKNRWINQLNNIKGCSFGLQGKFRNQDMEIYYNGEVNKAWIFLNDSLQIIMQGNGLPTLDDFFTTRNKAAGLYIRLRANSAFQKPDAIRLSMLTQFVFQSVSQSVYEYD